jgi:uncharacterized OB-fold protein
MTDETILTRHLPAPAISEDARPFWDAAKQGRFLIKRCADCGKAHWYPRALCPFCLSDQTEWVESPGEGSIYSFSVMRRSPTGPYAIGYVTLDEGVNVLTNFVGCAPKDLKIGARVKVQFAETDGDPPAPVFALMSEGG